jgi:hypothetical protein
VLQAKARLAENHRRHGADLVGDGRLELLRRAIPLLMRASCRGTPDDVSGLPETPTPVDIKLVPPATALLVTGPTPVARPSR